MMKREQILTKLDQAWSAFNESYAGLSGIQMAEPGVTGDWSIKDILAHVSWWEEEALQHLPTILKGGRPPRYSTLYGGIDAFNAQMTELKRNLSLPAVQSQLGETHRRLIEYLQTIPDEQFGSETRFCKRLRQDTYSHYPIHTRAIHEWRKLST